jgi:proline iminopeptidase
MDRPIANFKDPVNWLYPLTETYNTYRLPVSHGHELYVEECGNPNGIPIVFLHGGPGGGIDPDHRRFFNPEKFRIILFDQRGAGKSTPHASLEHNTVWDLVADIEAIRIRSNIDKWHVFGGSWGSTLALTYAATHPDRVSSLVLRGIFLLRKEEVDWFYQEGASRVFPDAWEDFLAPIPAAERHDMVTAYYKRLTHSDPNVRLPAAKAWSIWEGRTSKLYTPKADTVKFGQDIFAEAFARIECHYFTNKGFYTEDGYLLKAVQKIRHLPCVIVQGRYDMCCPVKSAWDLAKAWPEAVLQIIPDSGHSAFEAGIARALVAHLDAL